MGGLFFCNILAFIPHTGDTVVSSNRSSSSSSSSSKGYAEFCPCYVVLRYRYRRACLRDGREHEPDGGAAQSLRYRYRRACCGPKALPIGLRDREVAAPSLSYREPPSTRSVVVY
eukprot:COSAG06_NODE_3223_length_5656_cov_23.309340_1_plen_114_part_10